MTRAAKVIQKNSKIELVINRSRFLGQCFIVKSSDEVQSTLEAIRKKYWDATHNCFAYILKDGMARFSDDGEPSGTAGMPIMEVLKSNAAIDVLCVVTRYFGGILLGAGGLVRAYSKAASSALQEAGLFILVPCVTYRVTSPYGLYSKIESKLEKSDVKLLDHDYGAEVSFTAQMRQDREDEFLTQVKEISAGTVTPSLTAREEMPMDEKA